MNASMLALPIGILIVFIHPLTALELPVIFLLTYTVLAIVSHELLMYT